MSSSYSYEWACGIADSAVRELSGLDEGEEEVPTSLIVRAIDILKKRTPFTDAHGRAQDLSKVLRLRSDDAQARREANAEGEQYEEYAAWRKGHLPNEQDVGAVHFTHLRAHETSLHLVCRLLLEQKNTHAQGTNIGCCLHL